MTFEASRSEERVLTLGEADDRRERDQEQANEPDGLQSVDRRWLVLAGDKAEGSCDPPTTARRSRKDIGKSERYGHGEEQKTHGLSANPEDLAFCTRLAHGFFSDSGGRAMPMIFASPMNEISHAECGDPALGAQVKPLTLLVFCAEIWVCRGPEAQLLRTSRATASVCGVCGKRSIGTTCSIRYDTQRRPRSRASVVGLQDT